MALYAIGDLHLSLSSNKPMDVFGPAWANHVERLKDAFAELKDDDVTVLCGDLSWGSSMEESLQDFLFIDALPGKKIVLKGNHDYWWNTATKMRRFFAENGITSIDILFNNCFFYGDYAICGLPKAVEEEIGVDEDDMNDISSFLRSIEGVKMSALLRQSDETHIKVSVRAVPGYSAAVICEQFGGGGHAGAAGCSVKMSMENAMETIGKAMMAY